MDKVDGAHQALDLGPNWLPSPTKPGTLVQEVPYRWGLTKGKIPKQELKFAQMDKVQGASEFMWQDLPRCWQRGHNIPGDPILIPKKVSWEVIGSQEDGDTDPHPHMGLFTLETCCGHPFLECGCSRWATRNNALWKTNAA